MMDHLKYSSKAWYTNNTHIAQDEKLKMNVLVYNICKKSIQDNSFSKPTSNIDVNTIFQIPTKIWLFTFCLNY